MGRDPAEQETPDLLPTAAVHDASAPPKLPASEATTETATQRYILPKDLPNALKHLSDREFDLMHLAILDTKERRTVDMLKSR
jgi:hypothetical protein